MQSYITTLMYHQPRVQEGEWGSSQGGPTEIDRNRKMKGREVDRTGDDATYRQAPSLFASTAGMKRGL